MKVGRNVGPELDRPSGEFRCYLFHGPDESGSRTLAKRLLKGLGADREALAGAELKDDANRLVAMGSSSSLFGDVAIAWVEPAGDESLAAIERLLDSDSERPAIAIAGQLRKTSKLLQLVEGHPRGFAKASYALEGRELEGFVAAAGQQAGLRIAPDLARWIGDACAANQNLIANEIEKFALYLGASSEVPKALDAETVEVLGAETDSADLFRLGDLAVSGRVGELAEALSDGRLIGNEIGLLRSLQRRMLQLAPLRARVEEGQSAMSVVDSARPPIFFKEKALVTAMLSRWNARQIATAVDRLAGLEKQVMLQGAPDEASMGETLTTFARVAARRR